MTKEADKLDYLTEMVKEQHVETKKWRKTIEIRMTKTETELFMYKTIIQTIKWLGSLAILILTLRFGDVYKYLFPSG